MDKPNFSGNYKLTKNENMDEYLAANGVPWLVRKMASKTTPTLEIIQNGDNFSTKLSTTLFTFNVQFQMNQEFEEQQPNGVIMKVFPTWDDNKIVMNYRSKNPGEGKDQVITREMKDDELIMTLKIDDVIAKRYFKKS